MPKFLDRRDPFWDDGRGVRRARTQRRIVRLGVLLIGAIVLGVVVTRLPAIDPTFVTSDSGRPFLGGALLALLASCILVGLSRMARPDAS